MMSCMRCINYGSESQRRVLYQYTVPEKMLSEYMLFLEGRACP